MVQCVENTDLLIHAVKTTKHGDIERRTKRRRLYGRRPRHVAYTLSLARHHTRHRTQ